MHLVQLLLPVYDNTGTPFSREMLEKVARELTDRFGGLTAYTRAPAQGRWREGGEDEVAHDEIIVYEVMAESLDREWWSKYRATLEARFEQETLVVRAHRIELL